MSLNCEDCPIEQCYVETESLCNKYCGDMKDFLNDIMLNTLDKFVKIIDEKILPHYCVDGIMFDKDIYWELEVCKKEITDEGKGLWCNY